MPPPVRRRRRRGRAAAVPAARRCVAAAARLRSASRSSLVLVLLRPLDPLRSIRSCGCSARRSSRRATIFDNKLIPHDWAWNFTGENRLRARRRAALQRRARSRTGCGTASGSACSARCSSTFSSAIVAFSFAYFRFPCRNVLFALLLATMMLPAQVTMIPVYLIWNKIGHVHDRPLVAAAHRHQHAVPALGAEPVRERLLHLPAAAVLPRASRATTSRRRGWTATATSRCSGGSRCRWRSRR